MDGIPTLNIRFDSGSYDECIDKIVALGVNAHVFVDVQGPDFDEIARLRAKYPKVNFSFGV